MNCRMFCILITSVLACRACYGVAIQPDEPASQDGFVYQFLATTNLEGSFGTLLSAGKTSSAHDTESFLQFDLSSVPYAAVDVTSATLSLWVGDTTTAGFGANPSASSPSQIDLYAATSAWTEAGLTYATKPTVAGVATDSLSVSGIDQWVNFDVTDLVVDWLDGSLTNNGLSLVANAVVTNDQEVTVAVVFDSSATANKPLLTIVPEPAAVWLALMALPSLVWTAWRRTRRTVKST